MEINTVDLNNKITYRSIERNIAVINSMLHGKLGDVRRQIDRHDKYLKVINDAVKNQQGIKDWVIEKEKDHIDIRIDMDMTELQRDLKKRKVLQKCMELKKKSSEQELYGQYRGRSVVSFSHDIDNYLEDNTPAIMKSRKVKTMMEHGEQKGFILGTDTVLEKVQTYFQDKWGVEYKPTTNKAKEENVFAKRRKSSVAVLKGGPQTLFGGGNKALPSIPQRPPLINRDNRKQSIPHANNQFGSTNMEQLRDKKVSKKQKLEKLTKKQMCSKPNCTGYIGIRDKDSEYGTLPTINEDV